MNAFVQSLVKQAREAARSTLRLYLTPPFYGATPTREPTESEVDAFLDAIADNPHLVPSFDPNDPA